MNESDPNSLVGSFDGLYCGCLSSLGGGGGWKQKDFLILQKQRSFAIQKRSRKKMCSLLGGSSQDLQVINNHGDCKSPKLFPFQMT